MTKRIYTLEQKERKRLYDIEYRKKNAEKKKEQGKQWREVNAEKKKETDKKWYEENKERKRLYDAEYREQNADTKKSKDKQYYQENKEKIKEKVKDYRQENKQKINEYQKIRKQNDPLYKLTCNLRGLIKQAFKRKGLNKLTKTEIILGCTFSEFKQHIESLWEPWMNWDNYGNPKDGVYKPNKTWDFDHIIPMKEGMTEIEIIKLNHYTNIQPLCSYVNRWVKKDII
jgi:hypothetical protein